MTTPLRHAALLLLAVALTGCGSSLETVTVPSGPSSVQAPSVTDTVRVEQLPPVPARGTPTSPVEVEVSGWTREGPELRVVRVTVDRRTEDQEVVLQYESGSETRTTRYAMPSYGEALDIEPQVQRAARSGTAQPAADTVTIRDTVRIDTVATAQVRGTPEDRDVEARVPEDDAGLWDQITSRLAWLGGLVLIAAGLYALRTFTNLIPF
jgi:ABC-type glycerol-3-phosphate transport system substrate-binding protein